MDTIETLKKNISFLMKHFKVNKKEFCESIGYSYSTFKALYLRDTVPSVNLPAKICKTYNVNINWLMLNVGDPFLSEKDEPVDLEGLNKLLESISGAKSLSKEKQEALAKFIEGQIILLHS